MSDVRDILELDRPSTPDCFAQDQSKKAVVIFFNSEMNMERYFDALNDRSIFLVFR